jgi:hypothetical protein
LSRGRWRNAEPKPSANGERRGYLHDIDAEGRVIRIAWLYDAFLIYGEGSIERVLFDRLDRSWKVMGFDHWESTGQESRRLRGLRATNRVSHEYQYQHGRLVTEHEWWAESREPFWERKAVWTKKRVQRFDYTYGSTGNLESIVGTFLEGADVGTRWVVYRSMPKGDTMKTLIDRVESGLANEIPEVLLRARIKDRVYCLILYYSSGNSEFPPHLALGRDGDRQRLLSEKGGEAKYELWIPPQFPLMRHPGLQVVEAGLLADCDLLNQQLAARDDCRAAPRVLNAIAKRLMSHDWRRIVPVTDDFVVFALDVGEDAFDRNLKASVPKDIIDSLRSRDLLP